MRSRWMLIFALLAGSCGGEKDLRTEEIWLIDFETHADEVADIVLSQDLSLFDLEQQTLEHLREFYEDLPITFELGSGGGPTKSSICVREGDDVRVGRGILDLGNTSVVHDCGRGGEGIPRGAFIDRVAALYAPQVAGRGYGRDERTDYFARLLALVLAHEIGHGLGLVHSDGIMAPFPDFSIERRHSFSPEQRAELLENLKR